MSPWGPLFRQVLQKFAKSQGRRILTRVGTRLAAGAAAAGGAGAAAGAAKAGAAAATAGTTAAGTAAAAGGGQILRTVASRFPPLLYPVTIPVAALIVYGSQMMEEPTKEVKQVKTVRELRAERQQSNQSDHPK